MIEGLESFVLPGHSGGLKTNKDTATPMGAKGEEKRQRIIDAANALFYHQGFTATSFADIAEHAGMPKGNFYFYFRTKEALLEAVIEDRLKRMAEQIDSWHAQFKDPRERLHRIADLPFENRHEVTLYGCPMGTLSGELAKLSPTQKSPLAAMYSLILLTARHCLEQLGLGHEEAEDKARNLLVRLQGAANLAHTFKDERWLDAEIESVHAWIDDL